MEPEKERMSEKAIATWFWRWFLNNKAVVILMVSLLILLNLFLLTKVLYLFEPLEGFVSAMGLPLVMTGILYYLLNPLIDWLEKKQMPRVTGILLVFMVLAGVIVLGIINLIPIIREQILSLLLNFPDYLSTFISQLNLLLRSDVLTRIQEQLLGDSGTLSEAVSAQAEGMIDSAIGNIGRLFGTLTSIVLAAITTPFIIIQRESRQFQKKKKKKNLEIRRKLP